MFEHLDMSSINFAICLFILHHRYRAALLRLMKDVAREAVSREKAEIESGASTSSKKKKKGAKSTTEIKAAPPLQEQLLARVATSFCLVLNKCDLVQPKLNLLPAAEEFDQLLQSAIRSAVAEVVPEKACDTSEQKLTLAARSGREPPVEDERLPIEFFFVSATAGMAEAGVGFRSTSAAAAAHTQAMAKQNNSGVAELRRFLHAAAVHRPWEITGHFDSSDGSSGSSTLSSADSASFDAYAKSIMAAIDAGATEWEAPSEEDAANDAALTEHQLRRKPQKGGGGYDTVTTELDDREFAQEVIREKCFQYLHKEVNTYTRIFFFKYTLFALLHYHSFHRKCSISLVFRTFWIMLSFAPLSLNPCLCRSVSYLTKYPS